MHICLDNLGDGFITFPEFQRQLIALEREQDQQEAARRAYTFHYDSALASYSANYRVSVNAERCHHGVPSPFTCNACTEERAERGR